MHAKAIQTQAQAQEALSASAKAVHAMLEKVTTRAATLESILDETADRFNDFQNGNGLFGIKTVFSFLLSMVAVQNPKVAVITVFFTGKYCNVTLERFIFNASQLQVLL